MRLGRAVLRIAERLPGRKPTVFAPFEEPRLEQLFVAVPSPLARAAAGRAPPRASR
jgi:hypothetical protein